MIVERYLLREIAATFTGVTILLLLIFLSGTFIRILAEAAEGNYPADLIFGLFFLKSIANLTLVLPLSFFLATLLALGRLYRDSEMIAMFACGVRPRNVVRAAGTLAAGVAAVVALLSLYLGPWAEEQGHRLLDAAEASSEIEGLVAGRFNQTASGDVLIYVEGIAPDRRTLTNVFAHVREEGQVRLLSAARAHQITDRDTGDRFLVLEDGYRYDGQPGRRDFQMIRFEEHGLRIEERAITPSQRRRNAFTTARLLESDVPGDWAELQWRLAMPISTLLLGLLAVPLSKTSPRQGRYGKLFAGIMLYIIYNNLLTVARAALGRGDLDPWIGTWWVHLLALAAVTVLVRRQETLRGPRRAR